MKTFKSTLVFCLFCCLFTSLNGQPTPELICPDTTIVDCSQNLIPTANGLVKIPVTTTVNLTPDPNDPGYNPTYTGPWTTTDLGGNGEEMTLTYTDVTTNFNCDLPNVRQVQRTWTASTASGANISCGELFLMPRGTLDDIVIPGNFDGIDHPKLQCINVGGGTDELADNANCGASDLYWNPLPSAHPYANHPSPYDGKLWPCGQVKTFGTGVPTGPTCDDIQFTFEDIKINNSNDPNDPMPGYKILRKWTVLDWCTGNVLEAAQIIKVENESMPVVTPISDAMFLLDPFFCEIDWDVPTTFVSGDCDGNSDNYYVSSTGGTVEQLPNGDWRINGLTTGIHEISYHPIGCCAVGEVETMLLTIADGTPPVAICDAATVVAVSTGGEAKVFAQTFDDGSYDNCAPNVWYKVVRYDEYDSNDDGQPGGSVADGDWQASNCNGLSGDDDLRDMAPYQGLQSYFDDYVNFCMEDIEDEDLRVVMRIFDVDPSVYTFGRQHPNLLPAGADPDDYSGILPEAMMPGGPLSGHFNDCILEVTVEDKLAPYVVAPPNITITCAYALDFDPDNPNDFANAFDDIFGEVVTGPNAADPANRDSVIVTDVVCPAHPRFAEYGPASTFDDPCYEDQYDIFWGYDGYADDNNNQYTVTQTITPNLACNRGTIVRSWIATDASGNTSNVANQTITIINCEDFYVPTSCWRFTPKDVGDCDLTSATGGLRFLRKRVEWPCDIEINECHYNDPGGTNPDNLVVLFNEDREPRTYDDGCSLQATTYADAIFTSTTPGQVAKIVREWTLVDWCLYQDSLDGNYAGPTQWNWTQTITVLTNNTTLTCNDDVFVSLDQNCEATITPDMILEGPSAGCNGVYEIEIYENSIDPANLISQPLNSSHLGLVLIAKVFDPLSGNACWGGITLFPSMTSPTVITCKADVSLMLDDNCQAYISIDDVVDSLVANCNDFTLTITDGTTILDQPLQGTYTDLIVTVELSNGNSCFTLVDILPGPNSVMNLSSIDVSNTGCNGTADGAIEIEISCGTSPYVVDWSNGFSESGNGPAFEVTGLEAGDYTVTITDANANTLVASAVVLEIPSFSATIVSSCALGNSANGALDVNVNGGQPPYTFQWSNGATTEEIYDLVAGDYLVTITDDNGCSIILVGVVEAIDAEVPQHEFSICDGEEVQFEINSSLTLDYFWAPNTNLSCATCPNPIASPSETTTYLVIVTDPNTGCVTVDEFVVSVGSGCVWPGDTNTDSIVNQFDLLNIGLAFDATGPDRPNASTNWIPQAADDWAESTPMTDVNYKHIDANGDGLIDFDDALVIAFNWGSEHNFMNTIEDNREASLLDVPFYVMPDTLVESQIVALPIILGDDQFPVDALYGLAFSVTYDSTLVKAGSVSFKADDSWLGTLDDDMISLHKNHYSPGHIDIGMSRTDHNNIAGSGQIGTLFITIEDDVLFQSDSENGREVDVTLNLSINNIRAITNTEEELQFQVIDTFAIINKNTTASFEPGVQHHVEVFPNPADEQVFFINRGNEFASLQVSMYDLLGRVVQRFDLTPGEAYPLNSVSLGQGLYTYTIHADEVLVQNGKLIIRHH